MDLSVSYIFGEAWALTKKHGLKVAVLLLLSIIISVATNILAMPSGSLDDIIMAIRYNDGMALENLEHAQQDPNIIITIVQYVIQFLISAVSYALLVGCIRGNRTSLVSAFKLRPMTYVKFLVIETIYAIAVIVGCILLIAPGVYFGVRLAWAPFYIVEHEDASITDALKWSWQASDDRVLELLGLALIAIVVVVVASIAGCIVIAIGAMIGTIGTVITGILFAAALLAVSVYVSFAQAQAHVALYGEE